ncbi:MAG TPA: 6-phosphogluconolactonase [Acidimicrobiia bacterium]|nr:6-phosphogluconolactonase [Acidimicrobiia bacterium]
MHLDRVADHEAAAHRAADLIVAAGLEALAERDRFSLALSGGTDPWRMVELVSEADLDWERTTIFQVDERIAPAGDDDRNLTHMVEALPIDLQTRIRPMPVTDEDLEAAAARYAEELPDALDAVHLGLGPDGHTASLVPNDRVLEVTDRKVALTGGEYQERRRMTLTYPTLAAARNIVWLITGAEKQDPLAKLRAQDPSIPAGRVSQERATIVADAAALGE